MSLNTRLLITESVSVVICALCIYNFIVMSNVIKDFNQSGKSIPQYNEENNIDMGKVFQCYVIYFAVFIFFLLTFIFCFSQSLELRDDHLAILFNNSSFILFTILFIIFLALFLSSLKKYKTNFVYYTDIGIIVLLSLILTIFIYNLAKNKVRIGKGSSNTTSLSSSYGRDYSF